MEIDIFALIKDGDVESVDKLLSEKPLLMNTKKPPHESSLLHYAVSCLQIELVSLLADRITNINEMDRLGRTCLHYASWEGLCDIAKILIDSGADVNVREGTYGDGKTPLHRAAENGHADVVELLLINGADPKITIDRRPYKLREVSEKFPDTKWILTPKDCASTKAIQELFEKYERNP
ncbi:MAG: ankyrin repeat domain-containing protein [Desulfatiglandales bacterium]